MLASPRPDGRGLAATTPSVAPAPASCRCLHDGCAGAGSAMADVLESDPTALEPSNLATPGMHAVALLDRLRDRQSRVREPSARERTGSGDHRSGRPPLPTSAERLGDLVDSCFFATLLTDEGRPTRFACAYVSPEDVDGIPARRLARPMRLTPEAIRRISPAI